MNLIQILVLCTAKIFYFLVKNLSNLRKKMRASNSFIATLKETPAEAQTASHKLMLRAGLIRQLGSGLFTWLPLGLKVLRKVEEVVRDEMNKAGALEILMPNIQPADLWIESGRWSAYGKELLRLKDRHERDFCVGPTHEEVITDLARNEISSYKQLPINFYQIQTKFRDEIRPRFGIMRAREFIMKDAYSFHIDAKSLQETYDLMYQAYSNIFTRLGLEFRAVEADNGSIGGAKSHEFQVLAESGEDSIAFSTKSNYAANIEKVACLKPELNRAKPEAEFILKETPNCKTIEDLVNNFDTPIEKTLKTLIVKNSTGALVALLLRGDKTLNEIKAAKILDVEDLEFAEETEVQQAVGAGFGSLGPYNLDMPIFADYSTVNMTDFSFGANIEGKHYFGANWGRDLVEPNFVDLRFAEQGDASPDGKGILEIKKGIEVGHIFQLGNKYSQDMSAKVLNSNGKEIPMEMGCYGIGVSRIVAAAIEQNNDEKGIIWTGALAPYDVVIIEINGKKSPEVVAASNKIYDFLMQKGINTILDDRDERVGVKFKDWELIGIPSLIVIGDKNLQNGQVEFKTRKDGASQLLNLDEILTKF